MYKKFVASFMTALMAAMTLVSPALGATALNTYPTFLGKVGDFYVVVGAKAAASDITGAIDIAANLAQLSFKETTTTGTTSTGLTGTERKVTIPVASTGGQIAGSTANQLPVTLKTFHFSGLKEGQFEHRGTKQNYHDEVALSSTGTKLILTHSTSSPINGTMKMRLENNATTYRYVFDSTISAADFFATTAGANTTYTNPLKVTVAGREFQIVGIPSLTSFVALVGTVKTLSDGESVKVSDLTFKVTQSFSSSTAKIEVTDPSGNVVKSSINTGTTESVSYGGSTYNYRVLSSGATASGVAGYGQLLAGKGDIEKTFEGSTESTVSEFGSNWRVSGVFATIGRVTDKDYITVAYEPTSLTDDTRYFNAGSVFKGPNNYFEIKYAGLTPTSAAKVTIEPVTGVTVYSSTASTGYTTTSGLNGLKISTDVAGTIVNGSNGYSEAYIVLNASTTANTFGGSYLWYAFKDKPTGRIVQSTPVQFNLPVTVLNFTLSYGGPGATKTYTLTTAMDNQTIFDDITITNGSVTQVVANFVNKTGAVTTTAPELRLGGTSSKVDTNDVQVRVEGSLADASDQVGTVLSDDGIQVGTVKPNVEGDKVVVWIPPETVYGLVQFGKIGEAATTAGTTVKEVVAVTTAVGKLDSEVSTTDKTTKHLVLIGGSCANTLVQELVGKPNGLDAKYTCAGGVVGAGWEAKTGYIWVLDGALATGKQVVVAAGTTRDETRLVTSVLQQYATQLKTITASSVKVTGTVTAPVVTPA